MIMNIKLVLPRISKSRNAVLLIIKIKNSKINLNVSYKNSNLNLIYLKLKKNFKNAKMIQNMNLKTNEF